MLVYKIDGQMLSRVEIPFVVADSVNYLTAQFTFSSDWDDKTIWAQFNAPDGSQMDPVLVENNEITEDKGINLTVGKWRMSLFGVSEGEDGVFHRVTTNEADIIVRESGLKDGPRFIVEDIDEAEEIIARAGSAAIRANASADAADAATELANEATANANEAVETANTSAANADEATDAANTAALEATEAAEAATEAAGVATEASESANTAASSANEAAELATDAASNVSTAIDAANEAADRANEAADRFDEKAEEIIEQIATKQDILVSGENIKTINGNSIVGAGNIEIISGVQSVNGKTGSVQLNASDVGALPSTTSIPNSTSQLQNDSGFISSETDPTVPSWAKQHNKPTYTATEVGALPANTPIPSRTTDLQNDSGFITEDDVPVKTVNGKTGDVELTPSDLGLGSVFTLKGSVETVTDLPLTGNNLGDVYYVSAESVGYIWLKDETDIERWEQLGMSIDLDGYATEEWVESRGYIEEETDPTVPEWAKQESKPTYTAQEVGALPNNTFIPSKTSELTNDAEFITADEATPEVAIQSAQPTEEKIWIDTGDTTEYTDPSVRWDIEQNLTDSQKYRANNNIGSIVSPANPAVGKILRVKSVNADGSFVGEWADDVATKRDLQPIENTGMNPAPAGKVWTATASGAAWADALGGTTDEHINSLIDVKLSDVEPLVDAILGVI